MWEWLSWTWAWEWGGLLAIFYLWQFLRLIFAVGRRCDLRPMWM